MVTTDGCSCSTRSGSEAGHDITDVLSGSADSRVDVASAPVGVRPDVVAAEIAVGGWAETDPTDSLEVVADVSFGEVDVHPDRTKPQTRIRPAVRPRRAAPAGRPEYTVIGRSRRRLEPQDPLRLT